MGLDIQGFDFPEEANISPNDPILREAALAIFGGKCLYTGREVDASTMHIDHVIPKSAGGPDNIFNYALAAARPNITKSDKIDEQAVLPLLYLIRTTYANRLLAKIRAVREKSEQDRKASSLPSIKRVPRDDTEKFEAQHTENIENLARLISLIKKAGKISVRKEQEDDEFEQYNLSFIIPQDVDIWGEAQDRKGFSHLALSGDYSRDDRHIGGYRITTSFGSLELRQSKLLAIDIRIPFTDYLNPTVNTETEYIQTLYNIIRTASYIPALHADRDRLREELRAARLEIS